jgi:hypothetical protein
VTAIRIILIANAILSRNFEKHTSNAPHFFCFVAQASTWRHDAVQRLNVPTVTAWSYTRVILVDCLLPDSSRRRRRCFRSIHAITTKFVDVDSLFHLTYPQFTANA